MHVSIFSSHVVLSPPFFPLSPFVVTQIRGHIAGSSFPRRFASNIYTSIYYATINTVNVCSYHGQRKFENVHHLPRGIRRFFPAALAAGGTPVLCCGAAGSGAKLSITFGFCEAGLPKKVLPRWWWWLSRAAAVATAGAVLVPL